jgi:hypothetical protein
MLDACSTSEDEKHKKLRSEQVAELSSIVRSDYPDCWEGTEDMYQFRTAPTADSPRPGLWRLDVRAANFAVWGVGSKSSTGKDLQHA